MQINEIFFSLQGEGILSGIPTVFIRTTGCNLRCEYCDSRYAYFTGENLLIEEIVRQVKRYRCRYICITGGEPLLQIDLPMLISALHPLHYNILVETNGSKDISLLLNTPYIVISLDIKCPTSGMQKQMLMKNILKLRDTDQLKFVVQSKEDYLFAKLLIQKYRPAGTVFFLPVWGVDPAKLANWILADGIEARLGLQIHKLIWGDKKGK